MRAFKEQTATVRVLNPLDPETNRQQYRKNRREILILAGVLHTLAVGLSLRGYYWLTGAFLLGSPMGALMGKSRATHLFDNPALINPRVPQDPLWLAYRRTGGAAAGSLAVRNLVLLGVVLPFLGGMLFLPDVSAVMFDPLLQRWWMEASVGWILGCTVGEAVGKAKARWRD